MLDAPCVYVPGADAYADAAGAEHAPTAVRAEGGLPLRQQRHAGDA